MSHVVHALARKAMDASLASGPKTKEALIAEAIKYIPPGRAMREAMRTYEHSKRLTNEFNGPYEWKYDPVVHGARLIANTMIHNAVRGKRYKLDGDVVTYIPIPRCQCSCGRCRRIPVKHAVCSRCLRSDHKQEVNQ